MMLREPSPSMLGKCQRDRGKIDPSGRESSSSILRNETVQQSASITSRAKAASFDWGLLIVGVSPTAVNQPRIRLHWKPFFFRLGQSTYCTTSARLLCRCAPAILWSWNFAWSYWLMIFSARWNFAFISQPHTCIGCSSLLAPSAMKQKLKIHSSHFARTALPLQSIWSMQLTLILSLLYSQNILRLIDAILSDGTGCCWSNFKLSSVNINPTSACNNSSIDHANMRLSCTANED